MPDRFEIDVDQDVQLIAKVLLGDDGAARTLVDRLSPIIERVAHGRAPRTDRAVVVDDLVQHVWAHIWSRNAWVLQQWDRTRPLQHYIAVVARNRIMDLLRAQGIPDEKLDDVPDAKLTDPDNPVRNVEVNQLAECVQSAKSRISQTYQELIRLRHDEGLKQREIAERLGRTIGYVGKTLARAEKYLREEILAVCGDHLGDFLFIFDEQEEGGR